MKLTKRTTGWWITNTPDGVLEMGPYGTRKEAMEDKVGVERTLANANKRGFVTTQ